MAPHGIVCWRWMQTHNSCTPAIAQVRCLFLDVAHTTESLSRASCPGCEDQHVVNNHPMLHASCRDCSCTGRIWLEQLLLQNGKSVFGVLFCSKSFAMLCYFRLHAKTPSAKQWLCCLKGLSLQLPTVWNHSEKHFAAIFLQLSKPLILLLKSLFNIAWQSTKHLEFINSLSRDVASFFVSSPHVWLAATLFLFCCVSFYVLLSPQRWHMELIAKSFHCSSQLTWFWIGLCIIKMDGRWCQTHHHLTMNGHKWTLNNWKDKSTVLTDAILFLWELAIQHVLLCIRKHKLKNKHVFCFPPSHFWFFFKPWKEAGLH